MKHNFGERRLWNEYTQVPKDVEFISLGDVIVEVFEDETLSPQLRADIESEFGAFSTMIDNVAESKN